MTTLKEQRMITVHQWGRRDFIAGRPLNVPPFLCDKDERDAYSAGWLGEQKRASKEHSYLIELECPRCRKWCEITSTKRDPIEFNCGECLLSDVEMVKCNVVRVTVLS